MWTLLDLATLVAAMQALTGRCLTAMGMVTKLPALMSMRRLQVLDMSCNAMTA